MGSTVTYIAAVAEWLYLSAALGCLCPAASLFTVALCGFQFRQVYTILMTPESCLPSHCSLLQCCVCVEQSGDALSDT